LAINNKNTPIVDIFTLPFFNNEFKQLLEILRLAHFMSLKYDVMITNPPYVMSSKLEENMRAYLEDNYPEAKADLFAPFIQVNYLKSHGYRALVTPESWMFLISFRELREKVLNLGLFFAAHLGEKAFDGGFGTTAFILKNTIINGNLTVHDLTKYKTETSKKEAFVNNDNKYVRDKSDLSMLPNSIIGYLFSHQASQNFRYDSIGVIGDTKKGILTGDDKLFIRYWYEVELSKLCLKGDSIDLINDSEYKWFPVTSGGQKRKWYGNLESVVDLYKGGKNIKKLSKNYRLRDPKYYFTESISWSEVGGSNFSVRYIPSHVLFGNGGPVCFSKNKLISILGLLNSKVAKFYLSTLAPTINFGPDQIKLIPYIESNVDSVIKENISLSKEDWDSFEISWDFTKHPLIGTGKLTTIFDTFSHKTNADLSQLKQNEEELNEYFINLYGLQDELTKEVEDKYVSISIADKTRDIKSLISYLIGVLMGRYSLVKEGLIYAGGTFDPTQYGNFDVDKNGIIPIYSDINVEDGLVHRILGLIKQIYGESYYRDNIGFIAEALGKKNSETNEETLNRYLNNDFYNDHLKTYQKRPIYWMFSSGKLSGFKALIYMHRYDENTLAKLNASYFQPATTILRNQIGEIEKLISISGERELNQLNKKRLGLVEQLKEAIEYGQVLDYMANQYIKIDLDDGVKVNYEKFQNVKLVSDRGKLTKDLLIPIK